MPFTGAMVLWQFLFVVQRLLTFEFEDVEPDASKAEERGIALCKRAKAFEEKIVVKVLERDVDFELSLIWLEAKI